MTRADRPSHERRLEDAAVELESFIDKLIKTLDADEEQDCPTEKMACFDDKTPPEKRISSLERTVKKKPAPPPLPPADDTADIEVDLMDSLLPTQF